MAVETTTRMTPRGSAIAPIRVVIASAIMRASITSSSLRGTYRSLRAAPLLRTSGGAYMYGGAEVNLSPLVPLLTPVGHLLNLFLLSSLLSSHDAQGQVLYLGIARLLRGHLRHVYCRLMVRNHCVDKRLVKRM